MYAKIEPISAGWPAKTADKLRVSNVVVNTIGPNGAADVRWQLYSDAGSVQEGSNALAGDAYAAWGTHDAYLLEWLATPEQLGLTIIEIVPDAPAVVAPPAPDMSAPPAPVDAPAAPVAPSDAGGTAQ